MTSREFRPYPTFIVSTVLTLVLMLIPVLTAAQAADDTHVVRSGDTLFSIAQQYNVTVSEIRQWNGIDTDDLRVGMTLYISPPEREESITHTVTAQETLFSISRNYDVTIAEIQRWNNLETTVLSEGQELTIHIADRAEQQEELPEAAPGEREPIVSTPDASSTYYTVKSGDNLNRIAREHGMSTEELRRLNNLEGDLIRVGQRLIVRETRHTPVVDEEIEASTPQGRFVNYRLQSGESADDLLQRFSMTMSELRALNPETDPETLSGGQRVTILLPSSHVQKNPYRKQSGIRNLGNVPVSRYDDNAAATPTTSGELYNPNQLTAAHANMSLGSVLYLENPDNGRGIYVKVNDRFPGDGIKLSREAYKMLNLPAAGRATVTMYLDD